MLSVFLELTKKVETLKQYLPTYEDLQGTVNALLRLQDTYKLDTSDIAKGSVGGVSSTELTGKVLPVLNHNYRFVIDGNCKKASICH